MTFTYDGTAVTTPLARVRLEIGDTVEAEALFTDEEIGVKLADESNELLAAASLCEVLSTRFARAYDFTTDGQQFSRSQMSKQYAQRAIKLREQSGAGVTTIATTRIDGYSSDIPYDAVAASNPSGHARRGWTDPDLPS